MHIWIDGQCFQTGSRNRGIGRYVWELVQALGQLDDAPKISVSLNARMAHQAITAREALGAIVDPANIHIWESATDVVEAREEYKVEHGLGEMALAHHVNCIGPDIALSAGPFETTDSQATPLLDPASLTMPLAGIFYDAIPYRFPDWYLTTDGERAYHKRRLGAHADFDVALCISEFARRELNDIHPDVNAVNIGAGISASVRKLIDAGPQPSALDRFEIPERYVLYVGANDRRKNVPAIFEAYSHLPRDLVREFPLVLAGAYESTIMERDLRRWRRDGLPEDAIIQAGLVSDVELTELYRHAEVLLQPSLMEGFCLPSLEALSTGTPVLAADAGAVPEVVVGAPEFLFDPYDAKELAAKLEAILRDPRSVAKPLEKAKAAVVEMTWENTARKAFSAMTKAVDAAGSRGKAGTRAERIARSRELILADLPSDMAESPAAPTTFALAEPRDNGQPGRLLVDATYICRVDHRTGIQRVVRQTIENLQRNARDGATAMEIKTFFCHETGEFLDTDGRLEVPKTSEGRTIRLRTDDVILMLDSTWNAIDRFRPRLEEHRLQGGRVVFCLYDLVAIKYYAFCQPMIPGEFAHWIRHVLMYATEVVCISKAVADEFLELLDSIGCPRRIKVNYWQLGADFSVAKADAPARALPRGTAVKAGRTRFLMVGTIEPRKGYRTALDAFEILWDEGLDVELCIIGKAGWAMDDLVERLGRHKLRKDRLYWLRGVDDDELKMHYEASAALIAASYSEGFGLPVVEAGHFGKSVIATDIPVFHEVANGARTATFFEPGSAASLADAVRTFLAKDAEPAKSAGERAVETGHWPTWRESALQLHSVIDGERPYEMHRGTTESLFPTLSDIGNVLMRKVVQPEDRRVACEIVEGPIPQHDGRDNHYIVKVTNPTDIPWSSTTPAEGGNMISISWRAFDPKTKELLSEGPRVSIPFVLGPGEHHYARFVVPDDLPKDTQLVFAVLQEGVAWFST